MRAVITVIGHDTVGIIANTSRLLADSKINILDISQTIMGEFFTMIMMVDMSHSDVKLDLISSQLDKIGQDMGLSIRIQSEELFNSMHRI